MSVDAESFGNTCLWYGASIIFVLTSVILALYINGDSTDMVFSDPSMYLSLSVIPAIGVFFVRTLIYGVETTATLHEAFAAGLSGTGFAVPVALIGLLIITMSRSDYKGIDKWVPQVRTPEAEIQRVVSELELSEEVHVYALQLLEELRDKQLMTGKSVEETVSGIVYIAARDRNQPRTLDEISSVVGVNKKNIGKAYRSIGRSLGVGIRPPRPEDYLERFGEKLGLSEEAIDESRRIVVQSKQENITSGKSPTSIAASAIYLAAHRTGEIRTMRETSDVLNVTTITIRNRSREMVSTLGLKDFPENLKEGLT